MNFLYTFRGKLVIILIFLLIITLGVQYLLNLRAEQINSERRRLRGQNLMAGVTLGFNGISSPDRLQNIVNREEQHPYFNEPRTERIKDVIIIDHEWKIYDSLSDEFLPTENDRGETIKKNLKDLTTLPPLVNADRLGNDRQNFPNADAANGGSDAEANVVPIETDQGRYYVMVILKTDQNEAFRRAAEPLVYNLAVLLFSSATTIFLVWRFTRPIADLSEAARRIAGGDLTVRVPENTGRDEIGQLAARFNEMIAELEKKSELEAQLQQAEKSAVIGRLGSAIAHEIRNPLNYINLTLDHLRARLAPETTIKREIFERLITQLKTEVARINRQISDFLNYSRPLKLNLQATDMKEVVEDSLHIIEPEAREQNITINLMADENLPAANADGEQLHLVFNNLFINAMQALENRGGCLNIAISPAEYTLRIEISDTGCGISEEDLPKIFEPYFSTKETGTGLGLATVKKIIDDHKGNIEVESKLNEGTKFTIELPKKV
jgi:signal transduction histidine kinase